MKTKSFNKIVCYLVLVLLLLFFFLSVFSRPTTIAFVRSAGAKNNQTSRDYDSKRDRKHVELYCGTYQLYADNVDFDVEHVFAQSWANALSKPKINADFNNMRISSKQINCTRGNNGFARVPHTPETEIKITLPDGQYYESDGKVIFGWQYGEYFEPLDEYKGDVARILLYVVANYGLSENDVKKYFSIAEMKNWAALDKISPDERRINDEIFTNRKYSNYFITVPQTISLM